MKRPLILLVVAVGASAAITRADPGPGAWAELLRAHVNGQGEVAYRTLESKDRARVTAVSDWLAGEDPSHMASDDAVAFWINAYNAAAVLAVLRGESPEEPATRARMFAVFRLPVAGRERTLDELRALLDVVAERDPRVHFTLCGAARGFPSLAVEPYVGARLDAQLADAAGRFILDARGVRVDLVTKRVEPSDLFRWYHLDFERSAGSAAVFVAPFLREGAERDGLLSGSLEVSFRPFDWTLNAQSEERPR